MEKPILPYEEWPEKMKLLTAFRIKSFTIKKPGLVTGLSIVNIAVGLLLIIPIVYFMGERLDTKAFRNMDFWSIYIAILNIVIGMFNFFITKNAIAWVLENSSWEERDKHKSKSKYKFQYILIMLGIFIIPWGITCIFCC